MAAGNNCNETLIYSYRGRLSIVGCTIVLGLGTGVGNLLVIASVYFFKRLRSLSNFFLVSLAVADLLVGAVTVPLHSLSVFKWPVVGTTIGQVYDFITIVALTASSFSLAAVTYDRNLAISSPLQYASKMTKHKCRMIVFAVWTCSLLVSLPNFVTKELRPRSMYFVVFITISFLFPLIFLIIVQLRILHAIKRQLALININTVCTHSLKGERQSRIYKQQVLSDQNLHMKNINFMEPNISNANLPQKTEVILQKKSNNKFEEFQINVKDGESSKYMRSNTVTDANPSYPENKRQSIDSNIANTSKQDMTKPCMAERNQLNKKQTRFVIVKANGSSQKNKTKQMLKHRKYSITMIIVIGCFALCWLPNAVVIVIQALAQDICTVLQYEQIFYITMMISLGNSLLNPFIYCTRMGGFRIAFKKIIKCNCRGNDRV